MSGIEQRRDEFGVQFVKSTDGNWYLELQSDATAEIMLGPFPIEIVLMVEDAQQDRPDRGDHRGRGAGDVQ